MPRKRSHARDRKIVKGVVEGKSLAEIGAEVGISKQRVHQLLRSLQPAIQEALKRVDYDLDKSLTRVIHMTNATMTEEHFVAYKGIITDYRVVRKADNATRMRARELLMRLNVGALDHRHEQSVAGSVAPRITINLGALDPETAREFLEILRELRGTQTVSGDAGQSVVDAPG
jgi:hypothetical protein